MKNEKKSLGKKLEPVVRIGKSGLTEPIINEIKRQLKQKRLIKIKLLRSFIGKSERKQLAKEIAGRTEAELVDITGFTVVLSKRYK